MVGFPKFMCNCLLLSIRHVGENIDKQKKKKKNTDSICATMYYEINKNKFAKIKASAFLEKWVC